MLSAVAEPCPDRATESEITRLQREDPNYATSRGLTVVHFVTKGNLIHDGQWMMISRAWGKRSRNILETNLKLLSRYHQNHIRVSLLLVFTPPSSVSHDPRADWDRRNLLPTV